jgi:hypothetical protein
MTRIPREYTAQDNLNMAAHFNFNVSTNPQVVAERSQLRGKHVNIVNDQSAGIDIGMRVLETLDDQELERTWAELYGGAMLNSALYMLRGVNNQPMSRHFKLARLTTDEGQLRDSTLVRADTLDSLKTAKGQSESYEAIRADHEPTNGQTNRLGRRLGNASMLVSVFGTDFHENDGELVTMTQARDQVSAMHHSVQRLAQRIGFNPSLAQLRAESTPLGAHIMQSPDLPLQIKGAFRSALADVSDQQGY